MACTAAAVSIQQLLAAQMGTLTCTAAAVSIRQLLATQLAKGLRAFGSAVTLPGAYCTMHMWTFGQAFVQPAALLGVPVILHLCFLAGVHLS